MGVEGILIAVIILVVVFSFYGNQITSFLTTTQNSITQSTNAKTLTIPNDISGQTICDLHVVFKPNLDEQSVISISSDQWIMNHGASYNWFNCNVNSKAVTASLIPQVNDLYFQLGSNVKKQKQLNLVSLGQTIHYNLVVRSPDGFVKSYQTDPFLTQSVTIPSGEVQTPQQFVFDFVIYKVPRESLIIQVTSDIPINGSPVGSPYTQTISP